MYRTRTCGDLRLADEGLVVTLAGWVQKTRKMGGNDICRYPRPLWYYSVGI